MVEEFLDGQRCVLNFISLAMRYLFLKALAVNDPMKLFLFYRDVNPFSKSNDNE